MIVCYYQAVWTPDRGKVDAGECPAMRGCKQGSVCLSCVIRMSCVFKYEPAHVQEEMVIVVALDRIMPCVNWDCFVCCSWWDLFSIRRLVLSQHYWRCSVLYRNNLGLPIILAATWTAICSSTGGLLLLAFLSRNSSAKLQLLLWSRNNNSELLATGML